MPHFHDACLSPVPNIRMNIEGFVSSHITHADHGSKNLATISSPASSAIAGAGVNRVILFGPPRA